MFTCLRMSLSMDTVKVIEYYTFPSWMTKGNKKEATQSEYDSWDEQWQNVNNPFELYLQTNDELGVFKG